MYFFGFFRDLILMVKSQYFEWEKNGRIFANFGRDFEGGKIFGNFSHT